MERDASRTEGELISGNDPVWVVGLCWLIGCAALFMGGILFLRRPDPTAMLMLVTGSGLILGGGILAVILRQRRRFLLPTDDGFVYTTASSQRTYLDDDVMCVSLSQQQNYFWGNLQTVTRRFIIWVETPGIPERIVCLSQLKPGMPDPLAPFVARVIGELHSAATDAYQHGERVAGDGWALERGQLMLTVNRSTSVTSIADLSAIEIVDDHVNIWRKGNDLPIGRIPEKTANAHLLVLMLKDLMGEDNTEREANLPAGHLGRMIFERRPGSKTSVILGWSLVALLSFLAVVMFLAAMGVRQPRRRMRMTVTAVVLASLSVAGSSLLALQRRARFRRHAFGVHYRGMFSDRRLRYSDIANLTYVALRHYSHGIYNGTTLTMRFVPMPSLGLKPISYSAHIMNADTELDRLRDEISMAIAERMEDYWTRHGNCPWVPFLQFQGDALSYSRLTFTGRKQPILIPLSSIINFDITDGTFHIWVVGQKKPVVSEETSQPNFYPGLMFFSTLMNRELSTESARENDVDPHLAD